VREHPEQDDGQIIPARLALRPDRHDGLLRALITSSTG
jgi:hypothetical protein